MSLGVADDYGCARADIVPFVYVLNVVSVGPGVDLHSLVIFADEDHPSFPLFPVVGAHPTTLVQVPQRIDTGSTAHFRIPAADVYDAFKHLINIFHNVHIRAHAWDAYRNKYISEPIELVIPVAVRLAIQRRTVVGV